MKSILKNTGFIMLLTALSVTYIYNRHCADRKLRKIAKLKKHVEDAKSEYQKVKSDINFRCTESQLAKILEEKGLKRNIKTPIQLEADHS